MGVLNVTPDSFFDGGRYFSAASALGRARQIIEEGADIVDVGGESTRPGAIPVDHGEELRRVLPVVEALADEASVSAGEVRISVDTTKPGVARACLAAGARMVNDVSASPELAAVAAEAGVAYVAMHAKGSPRTMQDDPRYDDVVSEVLGFLAERAEAAESLGVSEVWVDPGIGFGKTARHNLALLEATDRVVALGWPVLVGTSRKSFLGRIAAGGPDEPPLGPDERFEGSLASSVWAMASGASAVRVHDVAATVQAARLLGSVAAARSAGSGEAGP
jgi:dihydropteroate synthase